MLPTSCNIAVIKYAGAANGINWQTLKAFLNGNSQLESNQPFIVPRLPPKTLVKISIFKEPEISSLPVIPSENLPLIIKANPSLEKLSIGKKIIDAINNADKSRSLTLYFFSFMFSGKLDNYLRMVFKI